MSEYHLKGRFNHGRESVSCSICGTRHDTLIVVFSGILNSNYDLGTHAIYHTGY